jgi:glutamate dehydrogenase/leucine dehydrogenase
LGGTRMQTYDSEESALEDVLDLSKAMTYKCALAHLPYGGGKAVIIANNHQNRTQVLKSYASMVERLHGLFKTGTDVGVMDRDVVRMSKNTSHMLGVSEADRGDMNTSKMAALGVFYGIKAALIHTQGSSNLRNKRIGIKGLGKLGGELARLASKEGAIVIGADTDDKQVKRLIKQLPNISIVPSSEIHKQELDIYSPCALGDEFNTDSIRELKCKVIVGGANNQLADEAVGTELFERGILYAPDYIANAGGLIYVADELERDGFKKNRVKKRVATIHDTLLDIFERSKRKDIPTHMIANTIARERVKKWPSL